MFNHKSINWTQFERLGEVAENEDIAFLLNHLDCWPDDKAYFEFLENSMLDNEGIEFALHAWSEHKTRDKQLFPHWTVRQAMDLPCDWTISLIHKFFPKTLLDLENLCYIYDDYGLDGILPLIAERVTRCPHELKPAMLTTVLESMDEADVEQQLSFVRALPLNTAIITQVLNEGGYYFTAEAALLLAYKATIVKPPVPADAYAEVLGEISDDDHYLQLYALAKKHRNHAHMDILRDYIDEELLTRETLKASDLMELFGYVIMAKYLFFSKPNSSTPDNYSVTTSSATEHFYDDTDLGYDLYDNTKLQDNLYGDIYPTGDPYENTDPEDDDI